MKKGKTKKDQGAGRWGQRVTVHTVNTNQEYNSYQNFLPKLNTEVSISHLDRYPREIGVYKKKCSNVARVARPSGSCSMDGVCLFLQVQNTLATRRAHSFCFPAINPHAYSNIV